MVSTSVLECRASDPSLRDIALCCVLGQDTLPSRCLSPPRCINGYGELNAGGRNTSSRFIL